MNARKCRAIYITSLIDTNNNLLKNLVTNYSAKAGTSLRLVDNPSDAEFIILADTGYIGWSHLAASIGQWSAFGGKYVLMINSTDWPYPVFDGFYPSLTRHCFGAFSWGYYPESTPICVERGQPYELKYLYSFVGRARTHSIRQKLLALDSAECPCIDIENIPERLRNFDYHSSYNEIIYNSHFVLCPRGFGASSIRLFEVMRAGRVPVIISDKWIAPPLGDWNSFVIKINEDDILCIPKLLNYHKREAEDRGRLAKHTYDKYFSSDVYLETIIDFYSERARLFSFNTLIGRAIVRSGIRELRSFVKLRNGIAGLRSFLTS